MISTYDFTQAIASDTWDIVHNLNAVAVNLDVIVDNGGVYEKIQPFNIIAVDNNTLQITFSVAYFGMVRIIAPAI